MAVSATDAQRALTRLRHADRIIVARPLGIREQIQISIPLSGSRKPAAPLLYAKHKLLTIGIDIRFRLSPKDTAYLFRIRSRRGFGFHGRHDVLDAEGNRIGLIDKTVSRSLVRSHYRLHDAAGNELLESEESSASVGLVRRIAGFLPGPLDLAEDVPHHFNLYREGQRVARYDRLSVVRDWSLLELEPELAEADRRLLVALAVGLDEL